MPVRPRFAVALTAIGVVALTAATALITATVTRNARNSADPRAATAVSQAALALTNQASPENLFTPIAPCRAIDTRPNIGRIPAGTTLGFHIRGTTGFPDQGGTSGGCGIPSAATAVAVSVSAVNIGGTGYLRLWPYGQPDPGATIAHYQAGPITTTGGTVTLGSGTYDISAKAFDAAAGLVVDITGYYQPQIHARVTSAGALDWATSRVVSASRLQAGIFTVAVDRDLAGCSATASVHGGSPVFTSTAVTGSTVIVYLWNTAASAVDAYFYLDVSC